MSNVRSQTVHVDGLLALEIVASDGRAFSVTKAQIQAFFQSTTGNATSRRNQVITWLKNNIVTALGTEQIDVLDLDYDFDTVTGSISRATIGR